MNMNILSRIANFIQQTYGQVSQFFGQHGDEVSRIYVTDDDVTNFRCSESTGFALSPFEGLIVYNHLGESLACFGEDGIIPTSDETRILGNEISRFKEIHVSEIPRLLAPPDKRHFYAWCGVNPILYSRRVSGAGAWETPQSTLEGGYSDLHVTAGTDWIVLTVGRNRVGVKFNKRHIVKYKWRNISIAPQTTIVRCGFGSGIGLGTGHRILCEYLSPDGNWIIRGSILTDVNTGVQGNNNDVITIEILSSTLINVRITRDWGTEIYNQNLTTSIIPDVTVFPQIEYRANGYANPADVSIRCIWGTLVAGA